MFFVFEFKYEYEFLEAKIVQQTSPEEAYRKFEEMGSKQIDTLRKLTKEVPRYILFCILKKIVYKMSKNLSGSGNTKKPQGRSGQKDLVRLR